MKLIIQLGLIVCLLMMMTSEVAAWSAWGHLVTTRIAYDLLMETNPEVVEKVNEIL